MTHLPSFLHRPGRRAALALVALSVAGCANLGKPVAPDAAPLTLHIAHINDHHSQLDALTGSAARLNIDGVPTQVELGGFARQTAAFKALEGTPNLLKIHAGDALTGTLYYTFFQGAADARMMNTVCFDAFTPGNHEFDDGDARLRFFLDALANGACQTRVVSSNVRPAPGSPLAERNGQALLAPWAIQDMGGTPVGLIGITIAGKTTQSSRPLASTVFLEEAQAAQAAIDALKAQGVRHIVAITHQGYANDLALAGQLTDVDVIIGGDSHTLLGDFSALGIAQTAGNYPTQVKNKLGEPVCVGQAWEYAKAMGLMRVQFDGAGVVTECGGQARLLVGEPFQQAGPDGKFQPVSDSTRSSLLASLARLPQVQVLAPDAQATGLLKGYADRVAAEKTKAIGAAREALCLVRVPGESSNRSSNVAGCEAANTLARGSDIAQVVAEAFLHAAKRADFALQNAGGVRVSLPAGSLSMNSAFTLLPFTNVLLEMSLTGAEVAAALEDAVDTHIRNPAGSGSHPYAAGLRWNLDMSQPKGRRFSALQVRNRSTGAWAPLDPAQTYVLATNDYIASGKDGYTTLGTVYQAGRTVNTYLLYTQSFVDYVQAQGSIGRVPASERSHQTVITAEGKRLP